jgi:adenine-specific DNA-methyltransferase
MNSLKDILYEILKKDIRLWDKEQLNQTLLSDLVDKIDETIIELLLERQETREKFFVKIKDVYVFKSNDFKFFTEENKINNSYTQYKNRIGLSDGKEFLKNRSEVVLDFPFKDCVLEGGQTTEEGIDTYFEYEEIKTRIVNGEKTTESAGYKEKYSKRQEIFFNQILARDEIDRLFDEKALVNWKRYTKDGESEVKEIKRDANGMIKENLIIKGNNLLALHSLKSQFAGKVKLIYIDPPYNTGNDGFKYNDNFNHSSWLVFMKNRLETVKVLLNNIGVIAISCDDNEQAYLKILCDDIFGKANFLTTFFVQVRYENKTLSEDNNFQKVMECIHIYAKDIKIFKPNKIKEEYSLDKFCYKITELSQGKVELIEGRNVSIFKEGEYKIEKVRPNIDNLKETWATGSLIRQGGTAAEFLALHLINRKKEDGLKVLYKLYGMGADGLGYRYILGPQKESAFRGKFYSGVPTEIKNDVLTGDFSREKPISNLLYNFFDFSAEFGNCRSEGGVDMGGGKKPEELIRYLVEYFTNPNDIFLDFFAGSGTCGAVAHKMNRQYVLIEQMNYIHDLPESRLINVINGDQTGISKSVNWQGGGSFIYLELAKWNDEAKKLIQNAQDLNELIKLFDTLYEKYFLNYNLKIKEFKEQVIQEDNFIKLSLEEQKRMLLIMLDLNQMYVLKSEMEDKKFGITNEDQELTKFFYNEK